MNSFFLLGDLSNFCGGVSGLLKLVGWVLTILKVGIPLIIIVLGLVDLAKAAISSKPEEIKKCVTTLIWRLVGGIALFFIPSIVMAILGLVSEFGDAQTESGIDYEVCYSCVVHPWSGCIGGSTNNRRKKEK